MRDDFGWAAMQSELLLRRLIGQQANHRAHLLGVIVFVFVFVFLPMFVLFIIPIPIPLSLHSSDIIHNAYLSWRLLNDRWDI